MRRGTKRCLCVKAPKELVPAGTCESITLTTEDGRQVSGSLEELSRDLPS